MLNFYFINCCRFTFQVSVIAKSFHNRPQLKIQWLLDFTRASRGELNSRKMLLPLITENEYSCRVRYYFLPIILAVFSINIGI